MSAQGENSNTNGGNTFTQGNTHSPNSKIFWWVLGGTTILVVILIFLNIFTIGQTVKITDAAAIIGLTGAVAVGIERIIEIIWSIFSIFNNGQWPLDTNPEFRLKIAGILKDFDDNVLPDYQKGSDKAKKLADQAGNALDEFRVNMNAISTTDISDPKFQAFVNNSSLAAQKLMVGDDQFKDHLKNISAIIEEASKFVNSFSDNPGRKLLSVLFGMILGLGFTRLTGVDIFGSILGLTIPFGLALTGITIGLGSSPTHEVIQLLTQIKNNQASSPAPTNT